MKDLTPVTSLVSFPFILVVDAKGPIKSVGDLVAAMKARKSPGSYGAVGGTPIVLSEMLKHVAGFDAVQVMYRNAINSLNDLQAGQLDFEFMDPTSALAMVREGHVRALAVSTPRRSPSAPDLPTMEEAGIKGVDRMSWFAALLPANAPAPIAETWNAWFRQILAQDDTKAFFRNVGAETFPGSPADLTRLQQDEIARWSELVKIAKMEAQ